ncbi:MAG: CHAT domain-containing protein, partial [Microbacterium sp.]
MDTAVMELEIGPGSETGSYVVRVLRSVGGGEPSETFSLDLDELVDRRPLLEMSVLTSSVAARRVMSDTEAAIQDVGRRLFDSAFTGSVATAYRTSMAVASERGQSVQIALRLTAPGLAALPWEALYDPETQRYLCRKDPLVRNVAAPVSPVLQITRPLRVLGMISSPRGLPTLDVQLERERLEQALKPHIDEGSVELHWLEDVSWDGLHTTLLERDWHVLHFIGHGTYDTVTDEGVLAFVGRDGRTDLVTASALADLLDEAEPTPRLVVLNSCQSGAGGTTDLFSGTAAALAHSGIRAVAAMQFSISDTAALAFSRGFYTALANNRGIDEAVRSGRIGILGIARGTLEWVTPVLYLRGDAHLFDLAPRSANPDSKPR